MRFIGNILWLIFGGLAFALGWFVFAVLFAVTIIGIPVATQFLKFSLFYLAPFGKKVDVRFAAHPVGNVIWAIFLGWELALVNLVSALTLCVTIIGFPFGVQMFKLARLSFLPFGAKVD